MDRYIKIIYRVNVSVLLFAIIFFGQTRAVLAYIAVDEISYQIGQPVTILGGGVAYEIYDLTSNSFVGSHGAFSQWDNTNFQVQANHQYALVEISEEGGCKNSNLTYSQCKASSLFLTEATFLVTPANGSSSDEPAPSESPSSDSSSGGSTGSTGIVSYVPIVSILAPHFLQVSSSTVFISYQATDKNDNDPAQIKAKLGLSDTPVSLYYSPDSDVRKKKLIAKDLVATSTYSWDSSGLPDSDTYFIVVDVVDIIGESSEAQVGPFTIDHSVPHFSIKTDPAQTKGEDVTIFADSTKDLIGLPVLNVTQSNFIPTPVVMTAVVGSKKSFKGVYKVVSGYDGQAKIDISGSDNLGNISNKIASGGSFNVGGVISSAIKNISPVLSVASTTTTSSSTVQAPAIKPVPIAKETTPFVVDLIYPREGRGVGGVAEIDWAADDAHTNKVKDVTLSYRKGSGTYNIIASGITNSKILWNVGSLKEGKDYEIKLEVSDGITVAEAKRKITIDNTAPKIKVSAKSPTPSVKSFSLEATGIATDNLSGVDFVEYSLDGDHWFKADMSGASLKNSSSFSIKYPYKVEDGTYDVQYRAVDGAGNLSSAFVSKITLDENAPRVGSYEISRGNIALLPSAGGQIKVLNGDKLNFRISLESDTATSSINLGDLDIPLVKEDNGLWAADLDPQDLGTADILLSAEDKVGHAYADKKIGRVEVLQEGVTLPGAEITVYVLNQDDMIYTKWRSEEFGVSNPIVSDTVGRYKLLLPPGKYYLKIQKDGYEKLRTEPFELRQAGYITTDFNLTGLDGIRSIVQPIIDKFMFYEN